MARERHSWKQFMDRAPKYACFASYLENALLVSFVHIRLQDVCLSCQCYLIWPARAWLLLNNWNLMKKVLCGFANIFELVTIALNVRASVRKYCKGHAKIPSLLKCDYDHLLLVKSRSLFVVIFFHYQDLTLRCYSVYKRALSTQWPSYH